MIFKGSSRFKLERGSRKGGKVLFLVLVGGWWGGLMW